MADTSNWFVAADAAPRGDGSREKPFHDPWLAFRRAEPGDNIHIAAGTYYGRFDRSSWIIDRPNITVFGGYSRDFSTRNPWKTPSVLGYCSGYEYVRDNNLIAGRATHSGLVLDGIFFDGAGRNTYGDKSGEGIRSFPNMEGALASFSAENVIIRNCIFANSAIGAVELSGAGSRFENNLLINHIGLAMLDLRSSLPMIGTPISVKHNAFCFIHDPGDPAGAGGDCAQGVRINCPAVLEDNMFVSCGNAAISTFLDPARIAVDRNLFFVTPHNVITTRVSGALGEITEKNFDEAEDLGFKSFTGNAIQDPAIAGLPAAWLDAYSRHLLSRYKTPPRESGNALRSSAGLAPLAPADLEDNEQKGSLAPLLSVSDVLAFSFGTERGPQRAEMAVAIPAPVASPVFEYRRIEWASIKTPDPSLANTRVELRVGFGAEQNSYVLADAGPETHMGVRVFQPGADDSIFVLIRRNTFPVRQWSEATTYVRGTDVEKTYLVRGIYRTDVSGHLQNCALIVESIAPAPVFAPEIPARPSGRDWFVRAGSSGGDGSREKPFRDPFQALERAEGGDSIHVAAGDYYGKLRCGKWTISIRNLAILGGYDSDFANRDPWTNLTRFVLDEEQRGKGIPDGNIITSEQNNDGLILDGFIFDGSTWNRYKDDSLDVANSPSAPLLSLRGLRSPVTVRNCIFLNASEGAVNVSCPLTVFENNIIVNTTGVALTVSADGAGPAVIRNNTILFACDPTPRAGTGKSMAGTLVQLNGRAEIVFDSNVVAFADNFGIRATVPQKNLALRNNAFGTSLYIQLTDGNYLWADASTWNRRVVGDSDFALEGEQSCLPKLPVDPAFGDLALTRLFKLPSRISEAEWKSIAAAIGASVAPEAQQAAPAPEPEKPAKTGGSSIDDLLAKIARTEDKLKDATPKPAAGPKYCPIFDYKKALALAQDPAASGPGARRKKLTVSFSAPKQKKSREYTRITAAEIDANVSALEGKAVEMEVTELRDSSTSPALFPAGTSKNDFSAFSVVCSEAETRTRLAIVIPDDTEASKRIRRAVRTDKVHVRGIAYATINSNGLSIVVDEVEIAGT